QILGEVKQPRSLPVLLKIVSGARDNMLCKAALVSLQSYDDPAIGSAVLAAYPSLSEDVRVGAVTLLASRTVWALPLLESVAAGRIDRKAIPQDVQHRLKNYPGPRLAEVYAKLWGKSTQPTTAEMQKQIEHFGAVVRGGSGSPYEGQKLFAASCGACHKLFGQGGQIGPDLTTFKRDDIENMLLSIVNPNAEIREGYESYLVTTKDDRMVSGFLVEQDNQTVMLRGLDGENTVLPREQISEMKSAGLSLMPEGLLESLPEQQVRDLFAYLRSTQPLVR
ncbi:MAG: c-type cytochrome, partial [Verrucomicrobiales bacterium]|nr:c-type cytochrome [Verrucomicrobiales bacterium]